jgi:hypothetical protein
VPECCPGWAQLDDEQEGCQKRMEMGENGWKGKFWGRNLTLMKMEKRKWNGGEEWEINLAFMQIYKMRGKGRKNEEFGNKNGYDF